MSDFYQFIAVNKEVLKFEFTKVHNPSHHKYFVTVYREEELVTSFEIKQEHTRWSIVQPAPGWAVEIQQQLHSVIEHFRNRMR